ncbi:MAG: hypothetical protein AAGF20_00795 [Pseudomonadota bacterium]
MSDLFWFCIVAVTFVYNCRLYWLLKKASVMGAALEKTIAAQKTEIDQLRHRLHLARVDYARLAAGASPSPVVDVPMDERVAYRVLVKHCHPDQGGTAEVFQALQALVRKS